MEELNILLNKCLNRQLIKVILSNPKEKEGPLKIQIRPILLKEELWFQETLYIGTKVFHKNYTAEYMQEEIVKNLTDNFKQLQLEHEEIKATVLVSKKGKITINKRTKRYEDRVIKAELSHNRAKRYIIEDGKKVDFMVDLGVMTKDGKVVKAKYDKFKQINRFLEFIEDVLPKLNKNREITIIDFGCGKSYLTFAMYYYLKELNSIDARIIGLDLKEDVIDKCNELSMKYGYEKLNFYKGDIKNYEGVSKVDMVVTLHACDTATDYALNKAVSWGAEVILSVPCCQHELNSQIKNDILEPVLKYGLIKERLSALITDALRADILEGAGYYVQILEFIDMEHTPKNILIRAVKNDKKSDLASINENIQKYESLREFLNVNPKLDQLLKEDSAGGNV